VTARRLISAHFTRCFASFDLRGAKTSAFPSALIQSPISSCHANEGERGKHQSVTLWSYVRRRPSADRTCVMSPDEMRFIGCAFSIPPCLSVSRRLSLTCGFSGSTEYGLGTVEMPEGKRLRAFSSDHASRDAEVEPHQEPRRRDNRPWSGPNQARPAQRSGRSCR